MFCFVDSVVMSVEKVRICGEWQLYIALFTDVTNLKELRQSVIDGELDVALISPSMVRLWQSDSI